MIGCYECGALADHDHHVIPRVQGGSRTIPLCGRCHGLVHSAPLTSTGYLTHLALVAKRSRGEVLGPHTPIGSRRAEDGVHVAVDPGEANAVARIHELRADGSTIREIAARLNAERVPARGGRWHATTVARVLARLRRVL